MASESRRRYKTWSHYTLLASSILHLVNLTLGSPVFSHSSFYPQVQTGRNIRHLPCVVKRSGLEGICMFAIDCLKSNGTHLGTCIDKFYFGSCCQLQTQQFIETGDITDNSIDHNPLPNYNHYSSSSISSSISSSTSLGHKKPYTPIGTTSPPSKKPTTYELISLSTTSYYHTKPNTQEIISTSTRRTRPTTTPSKDYTNDLAFTTSSTVQTTQKPLRDEITTNQRPETTTENTRLSTFQSIHEADKTTSAGDGITTPRETTPRETTPLETTTRRVTKRPTTKYTAASVTSKKPVKVTQKPTKRQPTTPRTTTPRKTTTKKAIVTRKPINGTVSKYPNVTYKPLNITRYTTAAPSKLPTVHEPLVTIKPELSTLSEGLSTISYVETTRAPRPKPKPTSEIYIIPTVTNNVLQETSTTTSASEQFSTFTSIPEEKVTAPVELITEKSTTTSPTTTASTTTEVPTTVATSYERTQASTNADVEVTTEQIAPSKPSLPVMIISSSTSTSSTYETTESIITASQSFSTFSSSQTENTARPTTEQQDVEKLSSYADIVQESTAPSRTEVTTLDSGLVTWTVLDVDKDKPNGTDQDYDWQPYTPDEWILIHTLSPNSPTSHTDDISGSKYNVSAPSIFDTPETSTESMVIGYDKTEVLTSTESGLESSSISFSWTVEPTTFSPPSSDYSTMSSSIENITTFFPIDTTSDRTNDNDNTTLSGVTDLPVDVTTLMNMPSLEGINYKLVCGKRMFPEPRIVGGAKAAFGKWPWQISLRQWRTSTYLHKCGAALLNENWAITAAHCVDNVPPSDLLLRLGEYDLAVEDEPYGYQERRVQIVASHPQFDPRTFEYDLALLRFYEPVTFQPNIIPVCVPEGDENFVGRTAYVTGWGRLYEDGPLPSQLQQVEVPVINNTICESMYRNAGYIEHIPHIFICAGWRKGGYDSCEGDSGGPMVIQRDDKRFLLAGVISWGIGCAEPNQPGVYTRISEFRDWINQILQF